MAIRHNPLLHLMKGSQLGDSSISSRLWHLLVLEQSLSVRLTWTGRGVSTEPLLVDSQSAGAALKRVAAMTCIIVQSKNHWPTTSRGTCRRPCREATGKGLS